MRMQFFPGLLLVVASSAFAAQPPAAASPAASTSQAADDWKVLSSLLDKDKNGKLTQAEVLNFNPTPIRLMNRNFAEIDANNDGVVTLKEYSAFVGKVQSAWANQFQAADTDRSGGLSQTELNASKRGEFMQIKRFFTEMDANKDGQVSTEEQKNFADQQKGRLMAKHMTRNKRKANQNAAPSATND